jgi:hypothetical protein
MEILFIIVKLKVGFGADMGLGTLDWNWNGSTRYPITRYWSSITGIGTSDRSTGVVEWVRYV